MSFKIFKWETYCFLSVLGAFLSHRFFVIPVSSVVKTTLIIQWMIFYSALPASVPDFKADGAMPTRMKIEDERQCAEK